MTSQSSRRTGVLAGAAALAGGVGVAVARSRHHRADGGEPHWQAATIYRDADDIAPGGQYPAPLAALGGSVEVKMQPAPGDRGTEHLATHRMGLTNGPSGAEMFKSKSDGCVRAVFDPAV